MDDLLIVRSDDRIRYRSAHRRAQAPLGANLGLIAGAAFGILLAGKLEWPPYLGLAFGLGIGLAIGGVLGSVLRPRTPRRAAFTRRHYDRMPSDEELDEQEPNQ